MSQTREKEEGTGDDSPQLTREAVDSSKAGHGAVGSSVGCPTEIGPRQRGRQEC